MTKPCLSKKEKMEKNEKIIKVCNVFQHFYFIHITEKMLLRQKLKAACQKKKKDKEKKSLTKQENNIL